MLSADLHIIEYDQYMRDSVSVYILEIMVSTFSQDQSVTFLLHKYYIYVKEKRCKIVHIET